MIDKPNSKPMVLGWLNPSAKGRLTLKQNKTKQNKVGFGSPNQNQNPPFQLVGQLNMKGFLSWSFFLLEPIETLHANRANQVLNKFCTKFSTMAAFGAEREV